jgi:hypothetical protein
MGSTTAGEEEPGRDRMSDSADDAIAMGRAASARLRDRDRATWADWLDVARAIAIGRTAALKVAGTNCPVGTRYNTAMRNWKRPTTALRHNHRLIRHRGVCSEPYMIITALAQRWSGLFSHSAANAVTQLKS